MRWWWLLLCVQGVCASEVAEKRFLETLRQNLLKDNEDYMDTAPPTKRQRSGRRSGSNATVQPDLKSTKQKANITTSTKVTEVVARSVMQEKLGKLNNMITEEPGEKVVADIQQWLREKKLRREVKKVQKYKIVSDEAFGQVVRDKEKKNGKGKDTISDEPFEELDGDADDDATNGTSILEKITKEKMMKEVLEFQEKLKKKDDMMNKTRENDLRLLDMEPAVGNQVENMRSQNKLCDRNVLIPEGPKYNKKGEAYRVAMKLTDRPGLATPTPTMILPRCCNCCKKSVLGCE